MSPSRPRLDVHRPVFVPSVVLIGIFVAMGVLLPDRLEVIFEALQTGIVRYVGWYYIAIVAGFVAFTIFLWASRFGRIRLGADDEEPEYGTLSWFGMLFSAGMGIGLLFFSVAEPISHFSNPPRGEAGTVAAAQEAMHLTFFHWGLHAWAIYVVVGLAMAYQTHRKGRPLSIRWTLEPILGERARGPLGDAIDTIAVFGTLFGVATSLGLGVMQINAGLDHLGVLPQGETVQIGLIVVITLAATLSVVSGLDAGIRRLSNLNLGLAGALLAFVLVAGPTFFLLDSFVQGLGYYVQNIVGTTFRTDAYVDTGWQASWTTFYWGWWIAWAPFVGTFIARISRGRTVRQFISGVLLAPTLLTFAWMTVFGNTAIHRELFGAGGISELVQDNLPVALFVMLEGLPLATVAVVLALVIVATFFVTSSDSGSLVIDMLTAGGNTDPPKVQRVFWATTEGVVAAVLLLTGGLTALETAAITTALPFSVVMLAMCASLVVAFRRDLVEVPGGGVPSERSAPQGRPAQDGPAQDGPAQDGPPQNGPAQKPATGTHDDGGRPARA